MKKNINNMEFIEPGSGTMPEDDNSGAPPAAMPTPRKNKVVTKEELEKSGMSLRDYLNAKQGLTRRKEKDPTPKLIDSSNIKSDRRFDDEGLIDPSNIKSDRRDFEESQRTAAIKSPKGQDRILKGITKNAGENKFMGSVKMASGGMISSASKRADGIATKGKTRGKIC